MNAEVLTAERILDAAEEVVRRHGPSKATVVDVARALGVSHGSVYRFFPSKAALREAVTARWLHRISTPLAAIAEDDGSAPVRLRRWFEQLMKLKRKKVLDDPELFAAYHELTREARDVVRSHVESLIGQLTAIVADGVARREIAVRDPAATARALFDATSKFHMPIHAASWTAPDIDQQFEALFELLLRGLGVPVDVAMPGSKRTLPRRAR